MEETTHIIVLQRPLLSIFCPAGQYVGAVIIFLDPICGINSSGITTSWTLPLFSFFFSLVSILLVSTRETFFSSVIDVAFAASLIDSWKKSYKIIVVIKFLYICLTSRTPFTFGSGISGSKTTRFIKKLLKNYIFIN